MAATELAHRHPVSRPTVTLWRKRWRENGIAGLHPGRLCTIDDEHLPS
jgi:transposase